MDNTKYRIGNQATNEKKVGTLAQIAWFIGSYPGIIKLAVDKETNVNGWENKKLIS